MIWVWLRSIQIQKSSRGCWININTTINADWFRGKFQRALDMRARLFDRPFYRLIHAESDGLPGVIIDRFDDHFVVQPNAAWADR